VGNHNIAGRMHRHHLAVMPYEPRRPAIYADNTGGGGFIAGQPCTASSGSAKRVGARAGRAGRRLADLLEAPRVPAGGARAGGPGGRRHTDFGGCGSSSR
jgi:hypothetical protein